MLFKANITSEVLQSENALTEQLYIFLNEYVPRRLRYESQEEREDCIQDTVMYLLKRFKGLTSEALKDIDIEKFFYNRTNSYISIYIRKLQAERNARKKYIEHEIYEQTIEQEYAKELEFVDDEILDEVIKSFQLDQTLSKLLRVATEFKLGLLGYDVPETPKIDATEDVLQLVTVLSYAAVDDYLIKSAKARASV